MTDPNDKTGLTKREHFAAMALQAFCGFAPDKNLGRENFDVWAESAVAAADALIKQLNK